MLQYQNAKSDLKAHFKAFFDNALTVGIAGEFGPIVLTNRTTGSVYTPKIEWEVVEPESSRNQGEHWLRFNSEDTLCQQSSLAGADSKVIWDSQGLINIQMFFSKVSFDTIKADQLKRICQKAFQGRRSTLGIWFRNSTIVDLPQEDSFFRSAINAEYLYQSRN
jgi:hypothetical protein